MRTPKSALAISAFVVVSSACHTSPQAQEAKFIKRGQALGAKKDYARALLEFRNAANLMPADAEPYYQMGLVYLESGRPLDAAVSFRKAVALNPKYSAAQLRLAELMVASRQPKLIENATALLQAAFGDDPADAGAIDTLALAEWKLGKPEDAARRLETALQKFPADLRASVTLAQVKLSKQDWIGAEEALKNAVAAAPKSSGAATALGAFYAFRGQGAKAESEFKRALQLDSQNGNALLGLGSVQIAAKRMSEAEQTYKRAASLPETSYRPLYAMFLWEFGDRMAALAELERVAKADPSNRDVRNRLVAMYISQRRPSDAEGLLARALKSNPQDVDALLQRAQLRLRSRMIEDAERDLNQVLHFTPDSAVAHFALAAVYGARNLQNNQRQELQEALRLNPALLGARQALAMNFLMDNQPKGALDVMNQVPETQKTDLSWIIGRNWPLLALGNTAQSKAGIEQALQQNRPSEAVFQNAILHYIQRDYAGARGALEELLSHDVADVRVAELLMETFVAEKEAAKGVEKLKQIAAAHSNSAPLQYLLGQWYTRTGNLPAARAAFQGALMVDHQFVEANLSLAELDIREGRNAAARQNLDAIIGGQPMNVAALLLAGRAEEEAGDHAAAIKRYRAVLKIDGANVVALNNLAYTLVSSSPDEALGLAQKAAEQQPDSATVRDTLGWIYYRKGLYSMAVTHLKTAVEKEPTPRRQFHLAMSYLKAGDQSNGQRLLAAALQKEPNLMKTESGW